MKREFYRTLVTFIGIVILCGAPALLSAAQNPIAEEETKNELEFFTDYAQFRSGGDKVLLEVYLMIPRTQLSFVMPDTLDRFVARGFVQAGLAQQDSIRLLDRWPITDATEDTSEITGSQSIPDIAIFEAEPGDYELVVQVIDLNKKVRGTYREKITLKPFTTEELTISDIEFASMVQPAKEQTVFTKYKRDVVPNASLTFGISNPIIYSYAEIYNMQYPSDPDSFSVEYSVLDLNNKNVKSPQEIVRKKAGTSSVDVGGLNVVGLSSGVYLYRIRAKDLATGEEATRSKKFYVYKPGEQMKKAGIAGLTQDYSNMEEAGLDSVYESLRPILQSKERKAYRNANVEGKRSLLSEFWTKRDPDPSTEVNEMQLNYNQRLQHVTANYGNMQTEGYNTDRGRIYLKYGVPDEVERNPVSIDVKPHEVWYYHGIQGGVRFVFVDKSGFGIYELVHSTARNELYDPNWQRFIETGPGTGTQQRY